MSRKIHAKVAIFVFCVAILIAYGSSSTANPGVAGEQARELGEIQKAIKAKGGKWKAGETSVSKLSRQERKRLCGLRFSQRPNMETGSDVTSAENTAMVYDSSFDWRNYEVVTGVKDQGDCGSCWAFAAVGAMESALLINDSTFWPDFDLSEQFVVSCDNENYGCCGGYMYRVYDFLTNSGTMDESCFPYNASGTCKCNRIFCRNSTSPCDNMCADWESGHQRISGWEPVPSNVDDIKTALLDGPVPCGMDVYTDFFYYTGDVYEHTWGDHEGGHAVIIIGWNDADGCWIAKNSWGTGWGEAGFFRIKWGDSTIGIDAAVLDSVPQPCPDNDGDGYEDEACGGTDCDDADPNTNPGATEVCGDGIDNNCDSSVDEDCSTCSVKGEPCVDDSDCCSGKCVGRAGKKKCG